MHICRAGTSLRQQCLSAFVDRALLRLLVQLQFIQGLAPQRLLEFRLIGIGRVVTLGGVPQVRLKNPHLNALFDKYNTVDELVVSAEKASGSDEALKKLKDKRLLVKDEIKDLLQ